MPSKTTYDSIINNLSPQHVLKNIIIGIKDSGNMQTISCKENGCILDVKARMRNWGYHPKTHLCGLKPRMYAAEILRFEELIIGHPDITLAGNKKEMVLSIGLVPIYKNLNY